jgi:hypothetical protein
MKLKDGTIDRPSGPRGIKVLGGVYTFPLVTIAGKSTNVEGGLTTTLAKHNCVVGLREKQNHKINNCYRHIHLNKRCLGITLPRPNNCLGE